MQQEKLDIKQRNPGTSRTRTRIARTLTAAAIATLALFAVPQAALASADKCAGGNFSQSCVAVNGTNLHVNWIKSRVSVYSKKCLYGHSQVLISGKHYADSPGWDKNWCSKSLGGAEITTGTWNVNRNYAKGTQICSKFWVYTGTGPVNGYTSLGTACATIG